MKARAPAALGAPLLDGAGRVLLDYDLATPMMLVRLFPAGMLGMGLTEFSMHPSQLLSVKQQILRADRPRLMREADRLLYACEPAEIEEALGALARA